MEERALVTRMLYSGRERVSKWAGASRYVTEQKRILHQDVVGDVNWSGESGHCGSPYLKAAMEEIMGNGRLHRPGRT